MTAALLMLCGCSSAVLPDPVQYAAPEEQAEEQAPGLSEVELKTVQDAFYFLQVPSATDIPQENPDPGQVFVAEPEDTPVLPGITEQLVSASPEPVNPAEPLSETDHEPPSATPAPEPVKTAASDARPSLTKAPETEAPAASTPKPTKNPSPTPHIADESVPVVVREETPAPEVELNPVTEPTAVPVTPTPTPDLSGISEYELAARVAYFEAGSEEGRKAVLSVIYNRCNSSAFGGGKTDIRTEVYRKNQFSVISRSDFLTASVPSSLVDTAKNIFTGGASMLPDNIVFFRVASKGTEWGDKIYYDTIGGNCFFAPAA